MQKIKIRKEKLSIYLVRNGVEQDSDIIKTENAKAPIAIEMANSFASTLYIKKNTRSIPPWTKLFSATSAVNPEDFGTSSNVGAAYVVRAYENIFILSFGSGFHLLKNSAVERDFGLKVTLNSVDPDKLRSLDKASYDNNPLNFRTQSTREVDIVNLQVDSEMEMLYALTGISKVEEFGSHVTGRDALTIAVEVSLEGVARILEKAIEKYRSPLPEEFSWVDNINRVRDLTEIEILDLELDSELSKGDFTNFWLGEPEIVDWESQIGYSFDMYARTPRHIVLNLEDYIDYLEGEALSVKRLKLDTVHINDSEFRSIKSWQVYRCLYAEIICGEEQYILRNGEWYKINSDFVSMIDNYLRDLQSYSYEFPVYNHDREEDYNANVIVVDSAFCLMDKKNIRIGGSYDKLEHCDLIKDGTDFVHVKYYRSSSTLSHLFAQGFVAAQAFVADSDYREKLNPKLPVSIRLTNPKLRPDPSKYKIVYAIATEKELPSELPFFSKVTLKNSLKTLRALNYKVELARIDVDPNIFLKTKHKPN